MKKNICFSIIIPLYNYSNRIESAINSALIQSINDDKYEIIVINDGSADNSKEVVENKYGNVSKVKLINKENEGLAKTRNIGVKLAKNDYIIFLDADDELIETALFDFTDAIKKSNAQVIVSNHIAVKNNKEKQCFFGTLADNDLKRIKNYLLDKKLKLMSGTTCFNKIVFNNYKFPEHLRIGEDIPFYTWLLSGFSITGINKFTVKVNKHMDSLRHNTCENYNEMELVDELIVIPFNNIDNVEYEKILNLYKSSNYLSLFRTYYISNNIKKSRYYYHKAIHCNIKSLFKIGYLRKYILSYFK